MTLKCVIVLILRYFTEFGSLILSKLFRTISHANYYRTISAVKWHFTLT